MRARITGSTDPHASRVRYFFVRVAGETYPNRDGTKRQTIIENCRTGEPIILAPEPDNPQDENAVRVLRVDGSQIGYLQRGMATRLVDNLSEVSAFVGGVDRTGPYLSVSLLLVLSDGQDVAVVATYARELLEDRLRDQRKPRARRVALIAILVLLVTLEAWWWLASGRDSRPVRPGSPRRPGRLHVGVSGRLERPSHRVTHAALLVHEAELWNRSALRRSAS
jgi:hypothetical protein